MERLILAVVLVVVAVIIAGAVQRRRPDAPTQSRQSVIPQQLDRDDFADRSVPWLVVVFSSDTCEACEDAMVQATSQSDPEVAIQEISWQSAPELHRRYAIDTVPTMLIAGPDGAVGAGFIGPPPIAELSAAMTSLRTTETG